MATRVCAIVGIGPGLGAAIARRFASEGFVILGLAREPDKPSGTPEGAILRRVDAGQDASLAAALSSGSRDAGGPIDVLIYNAYRSTMASAGPSSLEPADLIADMRVNAAGALAAARAVLPDMLAKGRGTILFTGGGLALEPTAWPAAASLAAGKAALRALAFSLHAELAPRGVHAGTVTVTGQVRPGTPFDPDRIAGSFWALHVDPPDAFRREIIFKA